MTLTQLSTPRGVSVLLAAVALASACSSTETAPAVDTDRDGLADDVEARFGTDPSATDTDGDLSPDGVEFGTDKTAPADSDGDGVIDALDPCVPPTERFRRQCELRGGPGLDGGTVDGGSPDGGGPRVCVPGQILACLPDGRAQRCKSDGSGYAPERCEGLGGICRATAGGPACVVEMCNPGQLTCDATGENVVQCTEQGIPGAIVERCDLEGTGRACSSFASACVPICQADISLKKGASEGCEFWSADLDNAFVPAGGGEFIDAGGQQYSVVVSNTSPTLMTKVRVCADESRLACECVYDANLDCVDPRSGIPVDAVPLEEVLVGPRDLHIFNLPRRDVQGTVLAPLAYHILSSFPIVAFQFNPLDNQVQVFSNDASLLLPQASLGDDYMVMTRRQEFQELKGYVTIIATGEGQRETVVEVEIVNQTDTGTGQPLRTLPGNGIPALGPGEIIRRTLRPYDVLNIETNQVGADLTGTRVRSYTTQADGTVASWPIVVFGGSEAADAPNRDNPVDPGSAERVCCADHLEEQLFPTTTWGREYLCTKSFRRGTEPDIWRVLALEDETAIDIWYPASANKGRPCVQPPGANGAWRCPLPTLDAAEFYEFEDTADFEIVATRPVSVGQFLSGEFATGPGCDLNVCNPETQDCRCRLNQRGENVCRPRYCIGDPAFNLVPPAEQFRKSYVFLAPNAYELDYVTIIAPEGAVVKLDGSNIDPSAFSPVGRGAYRSVALPIGDGVHRIEGSEAIGITVYGYDQFVSYGYTGGLNLLSINPATPR